MIVLFTFALLGPLGLVQGVQQCLYCTSGNHHQLTKHSSVIFIIFRTRKKDFETKNLILSDPDGAFHDYDCAVGLVNLQISYSINHFTKLGNLFFKKTLFGTKSFHLRSPNINRHQCTLPYTAGCVVFTLTGETGTHTYRWDEKIYIFKWDRD